MNNRTIDTAMAKQMIEAVAIHSTSIIGYPGGWSVILKLGTQEKPLSTQPRFELSDATNHRNKGVNTSWKKKRAELIKSAKESTT